MLANSVILEVANYEKLYSYISNESFVLQKNAMSLTAIKSTPACSWILLHNVKSAELFKVNYTGVFS